MPASDSNFISNLVIYDEYFTVTISVEWRWIKNGQGKHAPRFKSVSENIISETILTNQDRKVSGNPSSSSFNIESKLAINNSNSFNSSNSDINTISCPSVID